MFPQSINLLCQPCCSCDGIQAISNVNIRITDFDDVSTTSKSLGLKYSKDYKRTSSNLLVRRLLQTTILYMRLRRQTKWLQIPLQPPSSPIAHNMSLSKHFFVTGFFFSKAEIR